jgi:hypothetical protein
VAVVGAAAAAAVVVPEAALDPLLDPPHAVTARLMAATAIVADAHLLALAITLFLLFVSPHRGFTVVTAEARSGRLASHREIYQSHHSLLYDPQHAGGARR